MTGRHEASGEPLVRDERTCATCSHHMALAAVGAATHSMPTDCLVTMRNTMPAARACESWSPSPTSSVNAVLAELARIDGADLRDQRATLADTVDGVRRVTVQPEGLTQRVVFRLNQHGHDARRDSASGVAVRLGQRLR